MEISALAIGVSQERRRFRREQKLVELCLEVEQDPGLGVIGS